VVRCADDGDVGDRWLAVAAWTEGEAALLDDVLARGTEDRLAIDVAEELQAAGVEAVPVQDYGDVHADPQLAARGHFVPLTHPFLGDGFYERNGFRLSDAPGGYSRPGPTLGQDQDWVLGELLGLSAEEQAALAADGAFD
jgi:benzylsuccinate CoA-transferase BbsF subunit